MSNKTNDIFYENLMEMEMEKNGGFDEVEQAGQTYFDAKQNRIVLSEEVKDIFGECQKYLINKSKK